MRNFLGALIMNHRKIGIIGAGDIGFCIASTLALKGFDIQIYNRFHEVDGKASPYWLGKMGKVMDINDSTQLPECGQVSLTHELSDLNDAHSVIITAGAKRSRIDETREELACKNAKIVESYAEFMAANKKTRALIISNPVDFLTRHLIEKTAEISKEPIAEIAERIVGVSLVDTMRLINLVRDFMKQHHPELKNPQIQAFAIGEHGPSMVPLMNSVTINGQNLANFADEEQINRISTQTILRGNDIIKLTGASSVIGPAFAAVGMICQITENPTIIVPCSVWDGERAIGQLVEFENGYVKKIVIHKSMTLQEKEKMQKSCEILDKQYENILKLM